MLLWRLSSASEPMIFRGELSCRQRTAAGPVVLRIAPGFLDTREGYEHIAPSSSIVDPDATVRSRFMAHATAIVMRASAGAR